MTPDSLARTVVAVLGALFLLASPADGQDDGTVTVPDPVLTGIEFSVTVPGDSSLAEAGTPMVRVGGRNVGAVV